METPARYAIILIVARTSFPSLSPALSAGDLRSHKKMYTNQETCVILSIEYAGPPARRTRYILSALTD